MCGFICKSFQSLRARVVQRLEVMAPPTGFEPVTNGLLQWPSTLTASASAREPSPLLYH
jgi:hypothetical protein